MCHSSVCPQHHASPEKKGPQHQRVIVVVPLGNTVNRLDLSDLCLVDDLVSLLIFCKKRQFSRFAEMVSQVLESGRLRVNKRKLEVLIGAAGPGARRINAEIVRGAYLFTFRVKNSSRHSCQVPRMSGKYASRGADEGSIGLSTKLRLWLTLARSILPHAAGHRETWKRWISGKTVHYDTLQDPLFMCLERARKTSSTHSGINDASSEVTLGKELVARRNIPRGGADKCKRSNESDGVWTTAVRKGASTAIAIRPSVPGRLGRPSKISKAEEGDRAMEDARTAASVLGIDLPREKP